MFAPENLNKLPQFLFLTVGTQLSSWVFQEGGIRLKTVILSYQSGVKLPQEGMMVRQFPVKILHWMSHARAQIWEAKSTIIIIIIILAPDSNCGVSDQRCVGSSP